MRETKNDEPRTFALAGSALQALWELKLKNSPAASTCFPGCQGFLRRMSISTRIGMPRMLLGSGPEAFLEEEGVRFWCLR